MKQPWLSVVIPTYNGEAYLADTLTSITRQAFDLRSTCEVLVVDDGSTDGTLRVVDAFVDLLNIRVLRSHRVGNWVVGTNEGLQEARGEYVTLLHQDDFWHDSRLERVAEAFARFPAVDTVLHAARFVDHHGRSLGRWTHPILARNEPLEPSEFLPRILVQNFICIGAPVFRRTTLNEVGLFDPTLWYTPDWDYWIRLCGSRHSVFLPEPLVAFRLHHQSLTRKGSADLSGFHRELDTVLHRHISQLDSAPCVRDITLQAGRFSNHMNLALATLAHGGSARPALDLARASLKLSAPAWRAIAQDSRIHERTMARVRGELQAKSVYHRLSKALHVQDEST